MLSTKITPKRKESVALLLFLSPFLLAVVVFNYVPLFGWVYAFFDYRPGVPLTRESFAGLKYFAVVPVIFAIMISRVAFKGFSRVVQTVASIPNFLSWVQVYSFVFYLVASGDRLPLIPFPPR
jgi:ABC-type polysaccharide transport system permease subunit